MSKDKAIEGLTGARRELKEAEEQRKDLQTKLTKAEKLVDQARERAETYQGHLNRAIEKEIA